MPAGLTYTWAMSHTIQAVYENGVLRPLVPLALDEHAVVDVVVTQHAEVKPHGAELLEEMSEVGAEMRRKTFVTFAEKTTSMKTPLSAEQIANQQAAWVDFFREIDAIDESPPDDGLTNRDHDEILYGDPR